MPEPRIIKKYPNRRLYDTAQSRYVALDDIRRLVVEGVEFRVVDAKSEADITRTILLQIIVEQEEKGQPILSTELLEKLIRFYGDTLQVFMASYLEKSVDFFSRRQEKIQEQMATLMEDAPLSVLTEMAERNLDLWKSMQDGFLKAYTSLGASGLSATKSKKNQD